MCKTKTLLLWAATLPLACQAAELEVIVHDYSAMNETLRESALRVAARLVNQAGISIVWRAPESDRMAKPNSISLGFLSAEMAQRWLDRPAGASRRQGQESCGYSVPPRTAAVFTHCLQNLNARTPGTPAKADFLGALIAHEIGHLIIEEKSHSRTGIMKANWEPKDFSKISTGQLQFEPGDSVRMRRSRRSLAPSGD